jgi:hypothetical protein
MMSEAEQKILPHRVKIYKKIVEKWREKIWKNL